MPLVTRVTPVAGPRARGKLEVMDPAQRKEFGRRLARQRNLLGLSKLKLQEKSGVDRTTIQRLESGVQNPEDLTLKKLATALETTVLGLVGTPSLQPTDPKLEHLSDEDLDVAQAFHHATLLVKQRTLGVLQERRRREALTATAGDVAQSLMALTPDQRALIAQLIQELAQRVRDDAGLSEQTAVSPRQPIIANSLAEQLREKLWEISGPLGADYLAMLVNDAYDYIRAQERSARDLKPRKKKLQK